MGKSQATTSNVNSYHSSFHEGSRGIGHKGLFLVGGSQDMGMGKWLLQGLGERVVQGESMLVRKKGPLSGLSQI